MGKSKNLRVFNFVILLKSRKFDDHEIYMSYSSCLAPIFSRVKTRTLPVTAAKTSQHGMQAACTKTCRNIFMTINLTKQLLPDKTNFRYNLHSWHHNKQFIRKTAHVNNSNVIIRML